MNICSPCFDPGGVSPLKNCGRKSGRTVYRTSVYQCKAMLAGFSMQFWYKIWKQHINLICNYRAFKLMYHVLFLVIDICLSRVWCHYPRVKVTPISNHKALKLKCLWGLISYSVGALLWGGDHGTRPNIAVCRLSHTHTHRENISYILVINYNLELISKNDKCRLKLYHWLRSLQPNWTTNRRELMKFGSRMRRS